MKYFTEIIFWLVVLTWPYYRQSMDGSSLQTFMDVSMTIAAVLTLFGYWRQYNSRKQIKKSK